MSDVAKAGRYKGTILDHKVDKTKNGFIQFMARLSLSEIYNSAVKEWETLPEAAEITAYLMLTGSGGKNHNQIESIGGALGWDGVSLQALADTDHSGKQISAVIKADSYNGNNTLRVEWINAPSGFKPVSAEALSGMDSEWKQIGNY